MTALVRPADAIRGVTHRTDGDADALLEAAAIVLAPGDPQEETTLAAAARAAGAARDARGGLRTDAGARVLDASGLSIPGLYAAADAGGAEDAGARAAARAATRATP
jgi:predicted oxidoreductase